MAGRRPTVLIVGREADGAGDLAAALRERGWEVVWARDGESAFHALDERAFDCVVTELEAPRIDGMAVLRRARDLQPEACVLVVTDAAPGERVVAAMRAGAAEVQTRPLHPDRVHAVLDRGLSHQRLARRLAQVEERLDERFGVERLAGRSRAIARVTDQVRHVAASRATVLIEGEHGTGKGLVARIIHQQGPRRDEPFVWANAAALAAEVAEGELFGEDGAGGAHRRGRIELADGGTLFIEGVDALPPAVQVRLLRFLQDREFERSGGGDTLRVDARLIVSTSRDLAAEVRAGRFREDLFVRLAAVRIAMPPLRERPEDVAPLVDALLLELSDEHGRRVKGVTRGVLDRLARHHWPGNVRELRNVLEGMVVFGVATRRGPARALDLADLPPMLRDAEEPGETLRISVGMTAADVERRLIEATLRRYDKPRAAAVLGIGLRTLYRKIEAYGLRPARGPRGRGTARLRPKPARRRRR